MQNFNHLYYFYIVAKLKNVTSAAKFLNTSQPSLSTQIKTLEFNLDKSLFVKKGKYLELTSDGSSIFDICSRMFDVYEELESFLNPSLSGNEKINIGVTSGISRPFTTNIVGQVLKKYKLENRPKIKLDTGINESLIERLKLKKLDFIITNHLPNEPDLKVLKSFSMPVGLVGKHDFIKQLKMQNLKTSEMILKKASSYLSLPSDPAKLRLEINHFYLKNKLKYSALFESDILASVIRAATDGIGFCIIPLPYIKKELQNHTLEVLPKMASLWKHQLYVVARNDKTKPHFINKLISELELAI
ncbi:LysR family transcriptional regulator [Bacteriovorax sp. PP10]|uniref:LysR family transcriptional regulator n=1 Tax=Bacteriovorax antarcticus TaxID=3088717 RepID=A0ABU5VVH0_9BACT|nr:LysR family transcriptional regulator [Bacteriovorax sp. PP10]MEA9356030.1 LysR family transcriptional regulator [Bacteriovorax sp. PP10]